jgi:hypothetical protein
MNFVLSGTDRDEVSLALKDVQLFLMQLHTRLGRPFKDDAAALKVSVEYALSVLEQLPVQDETS